MTEKVIKTRIINKHADLETWESSSLILKEGEIALAKVMVPQKDGTEAPTFVAKIGNGAIFEESPWLFAKASDVYTWAKSSVKPAYTSGEISRGEGKNSVEDAITALETAVGGSGTVAQMIDAAIKALDVDDAAVEKQFVTAVVEADGKISVTRRALSADDIPTLEIAKINGLQTALDAKAAESSVADRFAAVATRLNEGGDIANAIASAKKAGDDAQDYAEGIAGNLADYITDNDAEVVAVREIAEAAQTAQEVSDAIDGKIDTYNSTTISALDARVVANATAIATEKSRAEGVESGLDTRLIAAEEAIASLNAATTLEGVGTLAERPTTGKAAGAIYIATDNNKEYVWNGSAWIELGDTTLELSEINGLKDRVSAIETDLGADGDITKAIADAKEQADKGVADAKTANDAIALINGEDDGSIKKAVADATSELKSYADQAEADAISEANKYTDAEAKKASDAAAAAQTDIDTHSALKNNPHGVTAEQIGLGKVENKTVAEIKTEISGEVADGDAGFVSGDAVYDSIEAAKAAASQDAATKVKVVADDLDTAEVDISTIKNNYARVEDNKLVYGQGDAALEIIFDCGGAN